MVTWPPWLKLIIELSSYKMLVIVTDFRMSWNGPTVVDPEGLFLNVNM